VSSPVRTALNPVRTALLGLVVVAIGLGFRWLEIRTGEPPVDRFRRGAACWVTRSPFVLDDPLSRGLR